MRYSTSTGLGMVVAALSIGEAVAGPAHAHLHKKMHEKRTIEDWSTLDWNNMGIDWAEAYSKGLHSSTTAPVAAATSTAAEVVASTTAASVAAATTAAASSSSSSSLGDVLSSAESDLVNSVSLLWEGLVGASNYRTSFGSSTSSSGSTGDFYRGNVGFPYASNIIRCTDPSAHDFAITFKNTNKKGMTINIWQKVGPDGSILSGSAMAPKNTSLTFYLAPGKSVSVAIQENTQIAWAQACGSFAQSGAYATTWGEANFVSTGSGFDVSAIMNPNNNNYDMTITSEQNSCVSSRTENMWLTATNPVGTSDGSCYIPAGPARLHVSMGGTI